MDTLSNIIQSNNNDTGGGGDAHTHLYRNTSSSSIPTVMFDKNNPIGPGGFTLLQGHIKLMAMVPNLPENQLSEKSCPSQLIAADRRACCPCPSSHSFPPVTPRMMPSTIASKYQQYYNSYSKSPSIPHVPPFPSESGYNTQYPYHDMWYPHLSESSHQSAPFHRPIAMMPSFETTTVPLTKSPVTHLAPPYMNPQQWLPPQLTYQQQTMNSYPLHYQSNCYPHHHPTQYSPYSNEAFPYFQQHHQQPPYPTYAVQSQSLPSCLNGTNSPPNIQSCGMSLCQNCCSLPTLPSENNQKSKKKNRLFSKHQKSKRSPVTECGDLYVIEEVDNISPSLSTSSSEEEVEQEVIQNEENKLHVADQVKAKVEAEQLLSTVKEVNLFENLDDDKKEVKIMNNEPNPISKLGGKKGKEAPVVVAVHDCFASDSSEAEVDADLPSYMDTIKGSLLKKRKPDMKSLRKSGIGRAAAEVFEDLDSDLNPDEARTYTCDYICELLASQDWKSCYIALQILVRLARHRPQTLLKYLDDNGVILWYTFNHITSPKSTLCRAAIVTFKELFLRIPTALDNQLDKVTEKLVVKSLSPNNFIRIECNNALMTMVEHCNLIKILGALENIRKKPHTRAAGHKIALARMALQIILTAGVDNCLMNQPYAEKLLPMMFCFMMEPDSKIRTVAKQALGMLMNHLQFESAVMRYVSFDRNSTEVFKKLDKMRGRNDKSRGLQRKSSIVINQTGIKR